MRREPRTTIEQVTVAAVNGDMLATRSLVQTFLRGHPVLADLPQPETNNAVVLGRSSLSHASSMRSMSRRYA